MHKRETAPKPDILTIAERDTCAKMNPQIPRRKKEQKINPTDKQDPTDAATHT